MIQKNTLRLVGEIVLCWSEVEVVVDFNVCVVGGVPMDEDISIDGCDSVVEFRASFNGF